MTAASPGANGSRIGAAPKAGKFDAVPKAGSADSTVSETLGLVIDLRDRVAPSSSATGLADVVAAEMPDAKGVAPAAADLVKAILFTSLCALVVATYVGLPLVTALYYALGSLDLAASVGAGVLVVAAASMASLLRATTRPPGGRTRRLAAAEANPAADANPAGVAKVHH